MEIVVVENYDEMSDVACSVVEETVKRNPACVLGLATGSTPLGLYERMVRGYREGKVSYKNVKAVNLDEYIGLPSSHPQSYAFFMREHLFSQIDILPENTHIENGMATDEKAECARYNALLDSMPRDLQVLGIGSNGHIAFNEPFTPFGSETHTVALAESTVKDNSRLFERIEDVPRRAFTMGLKNIMDARRILILASGANKANAVYGLVKGEVTTALPASILQKHGNVVLVCDRAAAQKLGDGV